MPPLLTLILCGIFGSTLITTVKPSELDIEETVLFLMKRMHTIEERFSVLESRETSDIVQNVKDEFSGIVQDTEKRFLEEKSQLLSIMEETEITSRSRQNDLADSLQKIEVQATEQRKDISRRISKVETNCAQSFEELTESLRNERNKLLMLHNSLSMELKQVQKKWLEGLEKARNIEETVMSVLERERSKTEKLQVKLNETREMINSLLNSKENNEDVVQKSISSSVEDLALQVNDSLKSGFENMHSNFTAKLRSLENSIVKVEKECANDSIVSNLDESLQNLEKTTMAKLQSIQVEIYPRVKHLEERRDPCEKVTEIEEMLKYQTHEISTMSTQLFDIQNSCGGDPPSLRNGKLMSFERKHGSNATYVCDENFYTVGNSTVRCNFGQWEGRPPVCTKFDASFYAEAVFNYNQGSVTCYSDENSSKIEFSRTLDTGLGGSLPENTAINTSSRSAVMDFNITWYNITGVYQCEFQDESQSMKIVLPLQYDAYLYFPQRFKVANAGDNVELRLFSALKHKIIWNHDGVIIPSWENKTEVEIRNVQPTDAGIYHCYYEKKKGEKDLLALLSLNIRKCRANLYGEQCDQKCPPCYNGGICHDMFGICVCPPGFIGNNCEKACPVGYIGTDCSRKSSTRYHCKPHPYGCACNLGYTESWCNKPCDAGWYGAGCEQPCHCANGSRDCNRFTGACSGGCERGWTGESCQIKVLD